MVFDKGVMPERLKRLEKEGKALGGKKVNVGGDKEYRRIEDALRGRAPRFSEKSVEYEGLESLTVESVKRAVGRNRVRYVDEEFVETLKKSLKESQIEGIYAENFFGWIDCIGSNTLMSYVNAVKFVSWKLYGLTDINAYRATFPDRFARFVEEKKSRDYINGFASMYSRGKLVVELMKRTLIPSYVLNAPVFQEAINKLVEIIRDDSVKPMPKIKACETILNYTKQPEVIEGNLKIDLGRNDMIGELRDVTEKLAGTIMEGLNRGGITLGEVAKRKLSIADDYEPEDDAMDVEFSDIDDNDMNEISPEE